MTNATQVLSALGIDIHNVANVTALVKAFITDSVAAGYSNFHIGHVVVTPDTATPHNWYTLQINYYNPQVFV